MSRRADIEARIDRAKRDLETARAFLVLLDQSCSHSWGPTTPDNIHTAAYTIPGWRGPVNVPAKTEQRWKRVCKQVSEPEG